MDYKILIPFALSNLLSIAYAIDNPQVAPSLPAVTSMGQTTNVTSPSYDLPDELGHAVDPYQSCFINTLWIVPPQTLLAYIYANANIVPVSDQTVWVISNYNQGYFSGQSYTAVNNSALSQRYLTGSVTPMGKVNITFYSGSSSTNIDLVTGLGSLKRTRSGQCVFIMQMNSGQNGVSGLLHWSYMIPVNPSDFFYHNLPGTNMSVPQFLAQF